MTSVLERTAFTPTPDDSPLQSYEYIDQNNGNGPHNDYDAEAKYYSESDHSQPYWGHVRPKIRGTQNSDERIAALDEYRDILETTEEYFKEGSSATPEDKKELGHRALTLAKNPNIYPLQVENMLLHVEAVDPSLKDEVVDFVEKLNVDSGRSVPPIVQDIVLDTFEETAEVAEHPEKFIKLDAENDDTIPLGRVIEAAANRPITPRINLHILRKERSKERAKRVLSDDNGDATSATPVPVENDSDEAKKIA